MTPIDFSAHWVRKNATQGMQDADTRLWVRSAEFGQLVRQVRDARGLTLDQLAPMIFCHPATIARYETGDRPCEYAVACQIADALGCPAIEQLAAQLVIRSLRGTDGPEVA